jgi:hypothetical protein
MAGTSPHEIFAILRAFPVTRAASTASPIPAATSSPSPAVATASGPGVDLLVVTVDDTTRTVVLTPEPRFEYFQLGDLDGDGTVGITDFLALLAAWGPCPAQCVADLDGDGVVGIVDFLALLGAWS